MPERKEGAKALMGGQDLPVLFPIDRVGFVWYDTTILREWGGRA